MLCPLPPNPECPCKSAQSEQRSPVLGESSNHYQAADLHLPSRIMEIVKIGRVVKAQSEERQNRCFPCDGLRKCHYPRVRIDSRNQPKAAQKAEKPRRRRND